MIGMQVLEGYYIMSLRYKPLFNPDAPDFLCLSYIIRRRYAENAMTQPFTIH